MLSEKAVLCVDNDKDNCELIALYFQTAGFEVISCYTPEEGIRFVRTKDFAAIITDFHFDEMDGIDLCRAIRTFNPVTPIVFFTGEARAEKKEAALEAGAQAYITKPADFEKLPQTVIQLINQSVKEQIQKM